MKYRKTAVIATIVLASGLGVSAYAANHTSQSVKLETAAMTAPKPQVQKDTTPTPQAAPAAPTPAIVAPAAVIPVPTPTPETTTDWFNNLYATQSSDAYSCMLTLLILKYGAVNMGSQPVASLQADLDYATSHYDTICHAEAYYSTSRATY